MSKVAIDLLSYKNEKALGYNSYVHALLNAISKSNSKEIEIDIFIQKNQQKYFQNFIQYFNIKTVKVSNPLFILIYQNIFYLFYKKKYKTFLFTANTAPLLFYKNYILVIHDLNFLKFKNNFTLLQLIYRKIFIKKSIKSAKHVIAISDYVKQEVELYANVIPCVIHNPLLSNSNSFNNSILKQIFNEANHLINKTFLIPSSLSTHKNITQCLSAIELICKKFSNIGFVFIGNWDISKFPFFTNNIQIKALGYVNEHTRLSLFNCVDYILFPSVYEGFGLPYLESVLFNKPIICSDIPIAREILNDTPLFIQAPFNAENIFNSINSVIEKPISSNNYKHFDLNQYNLQIGKKYINLF